MLLAILSVAPFVLFLLLLLVKKAPLFWTSLITLTFMTACAVFYWRILPIPLLNSFAKGGFVAFDILIIVAGAIFFLEILTKTKIIDNIGFYLESFSKDYRIQVIILAWFFEDFIEGTAGFGTPTAVVAPLLMSLGLSPFTAVILSLLGNSTSVVFGAAGTPIRVGYAGLDITNVSFYSALINIVGLIVPVFMLWVLTADKKDRFKEFFDALPFALWSGLVFVLCSLATVFLGQEFPSILGSILGLLIVFFTTKLGLFVPRETIKARVVKKINKSMPFYKAAFPYLFLVLLLVAGKFLLGSISLTLFGGVKYTVAIFNPGIAFIIAGVVVAILWRNQKRLVRTSLFSAFKRSIEPFVVIACMSSVVQLMIYSGENYSGIPSALDYLGQRLTSGWLVFWAPLVGAFGSFVTGSATVSNVMFGDLLTVASKAMNMKQSVILALALVGGAAGNMIALSDMLAAETVVGLKNNESKIIKSLIVFCLIYVLAAGCIGLIIT